MRVFILPWFYKKCKEIVKNFLLFFKVVQEGGIAGNFMERAQKFSKKR